MSLNDLENYKEFGHIRVNNPKRCRTNTNQSKKYRVFDSCHNISQILKFIPFYERLGLRIVNSKWNLSFYFSECWESLDYRFFDLKKHEFYLNNFKRFITRVKKLDICIDQISDLNKLICVSLSSNSKCVGSKDGSNLDIISDFSVDSLDIIETDNESYSDNDLNSNLNDSSVNYSKVDRNQINVDHLRNILTILKNLTKLEISDSCNTNYNIFTRVNPTILKFIESQDFSNTVPNPLDSTSTHIFSPYLNNLTPLDDSIQFSGLHTLIIDSPVDVHVILELIPFVKNIRNLVISRVYDSPSICSAVSELLEHIPKNQLQSVQIGRTLSNYSRAKLELSNSAKARQIIRLNFAYKAFESTDLDEGDEIISILLSNHSESLRILILDDIELSLSAYRQIKSFKNLEYSKIYTWTNISSLFTLDAV